MITALKGLRGSTIDLCDLMSEVVEQSVPMRALRENICEGGASNPAKMWLSLDYRPAIKEHYLAEAKNIGAEAQAYLRSYWKA